MASPICRVNGSSTTDGVNVTAGATITVALASTAGASTWTLACIGTDDTNTASAINATIVINSVAKTATFTAPATGSAVIFTSIVNSGISESTNAVDASLTTTFGVYVLTAGGLRVGAANETTEGSAAYGWSTKLNGIIRGGSGAGAGNNVLRFGATNDLAITNDGTLSGTYTGTDNYAAVQALINTVSIIGGIVYAPAGNYLFSHALVVPWNVSLIGDGNRNTMFAFTQSSGAMVTLQGTVAKYDSAMIGIQLRPFNVGIETGVLMDTNYHAHVEDVQVLGYGATGQPGCITGGFVIQGTTSNSALITLHNCQATLVLGDGLHMLPFQVAAISVDTCSFTNLGGFGINSNLDASTNWASLSIHNCDTEGNKLGGITGTYWNTSITSCHFEASTDQVHPHIWIRRNPDAGGGVEHGFRGLHIEDCYISNEGADPAKDAGQYLIYISPITGGKGLRVIGNKLDSNGSGVCGVFVNAVRAGTIEGNVIRGISKVAIINGGSSITVKNNWDDQNNLPCGDLVSNPDTQLTLANGANNDVASGSFGFVRVVGPSASYSISGFNTDHPAPQNGWTITLISTVSQALTIKHLTGSAAGSQIWCPSGADVVLSATPHVVTFMYDQTNSRWILISTL